MEYIGNKTELTIEYPFIDYLINRRKSCCDDEQFLHIAAYIPTDVHIRSCLIHN